MELLNLSAQTRADRGTGASRRARLAGSIPAVLYGGHGEAIRLNINSKALGVVLHSKQGEHAIVQLEISDNPGLNGPALVKEVQHHPVRGHVLHADLMRIRLDEKIRTVVPVVLVGRSIGIIDGGLLDQQSREVEVECVALDVPDSIQVDISHLKIGDSIHVRELRAPERVELITPGDRAVVAIHAPKAVVATEADAAAVPGAEGATPEKAEEGDKPEKAGKGDKEKSKG